MLTPQLWLYRCLGVGCHLNTIYSKTINWMITTKVAIWTTRLIKLGDNAFECLIGRIQIEYRYFFLNNNISRFETEWALGTIFEITNDNKFKLLF